MIRTPFVHIFLIIAFLVNTLGVLPSAQAQEFKLPVPGVMVHLSPPIDPAMLKGIKVYPHHPFRFDFILDKGDSPQAQTSALKIESTKLIKYFLASITIPEKDLWVNLSPYEKDRIIPQHFGLTEMGRDLLAEDYMLKQITASLIYPEEETGRKFWKRIYEEAVKKFGTTNIPVNTFNKVWIVPEKAVVYENAKAGTAYVVEAKLKVMLEQDYLSLQKHSAADANDTASLGSNIVREIVIPELTREVNEDKNFIQLRQVYNSLILATWYKKKIKDSILAQVYADKSKTVGVRYTSSKKDDIEFIYQRYIKAFKKGVFNYIKEDNVPCSFDCNASGQQVIPRKYFSGGIGFAPEGESPDGKTALGIDKAITAATSTQAEAAIEEMGSDRAMIIAASVISDNKAMTTPTPETASKKNLEHFLAEGNARALVWTDQVDALDATLKEIAANGNGGAKPYLRLSLSDDNALNRLMSTVRVQDGLITQGKGPLVDVIEQGGILLIDYTNSDPKVVESFNSLFDKNPYFKSLRVSNGLSIVGAISERQAGEYSGAFFSRFRTHGTINDLAYKDSLSQRLYAALQADEEKDIIEDLYEITDERKINDLLVGTYDIDANGVIYAKPGSILRALKSGKPLIIRGVNKDDISVRHILRQIFLNGYVDFNGQQIPIPDDFRIGIATAHYEEGIEGKNIISTEEAQGASSVWVINNATQDILFGGSSINEQGKIVRPQALLDRDFLKKQKKALRLRITDQLDISVWHRIMHAKGKIAIEVAPGVSVPPVYQSLRSEQLKKAVSSKAIPKTWQELKSSKGILIESDDPELAIENIARQFGIPVAEIRRVPITSESRLTGLFDEPFENSSSADVNDRRFGVDIKDAFKDLQSGKTVVLDGMDTNEELFKSLEVVLQESSNAYVMVNGVRRNLADLPGRLILLSRPSPLFHVVTPNKLVLTASDDNRKAILESEFPDVFDQTEFETILKLRHIFRQQIPAAGKVDAYPAAVNFDLSRLRLLYKYRQAGHDWLTAFERVILPGFAQEPQIASFMRTMIRLSFNTDYPDQKSLTIHGPKLTALLASMPPGDWRQEWKGYFWSLADTLSLDLLRRAQVGDHFQNLNMHVVFGIIQQALIEKESSGVVIDETLSLPDSTWQEQKEQALEGLRLSNGVMLKGAPGVGKSFITGQIAEEAGFKGKQMVGPVTVGADTTESDAVVKTKTNNGKTEIFYEAVARWAGIAPGYEDNKQGALLVVDEANLPRLKDFWNFLKGAFDQASPYVYINGHRYPLKRHKIIFTGNPETLEGRKLMDLIENYMLTVNFKEFSPSFVRQISSGYVASRMAKRQELVSLIVDLHFFFQQMDPKLDLSLRDVQELIARVNTRLGPHWSMSDVVYQAWLLYKGNFDADQRLAFEYLIRDKYGVMVYDMDQKRIGEIKEKYGFRFQQAGITLTDTTAELVADYQDFFDMRQRRLDGQTHIQGKRAMIVEGPSGRGKDRILEVLMAIRAQDDAGQKQNHRVYKITASPDTEEIIKTIEKAQQEGALVFISEINTLESGFLEGRLNDVLTGNAKEGFALIGTINSVNFQGREKLSSAFQNRTFYKRLDDYSKVELKQMAEGYLNWFSAFKDFNREHVNIIINAHQWIRDHITNKEQQPTTREFLRALELAATLFKEKDTIELDGKAKTLRDMLEDLVYGPLYLSKFLKGQHLPSMEQLRNYQTDPTQVKIRKFRMMEDIANFFLRDQYGHVQVLEDPADAQNGGGHWNSRERTIVLRSRGLISGNWESVLFHEISHGKFTRRNLRNDLEQDLEDIRHEYAFRHFYPHTILAQPSQVIQKFANIIANADIDALDRWMNDAREPLTRRMIFQYVLWVYADGRITPDDQMKVRQEQLKVFSGLLDDLFTSNPVKLAMRHLDTVRQATRMVPQSMDEQEIAYQDFRAGKLMAGIFKDFESIPKESKPHPIKTKAEQEQEMKESARASQEITSPHFRASDENFNVVSGEVLSADQIAAKKEKLRQINRQNADENQKVVNSALIPIEEDLNLPEAYLSDERLEEIAAIINDPLQEGNIVDHLKRLTEDEPLKVKALELSEKAADILNRRHDFKNKFLHMNAAGLRKELRMIESDLKDGLVPSERLAEIKEQFDDPHSPISLVARIEEFAKTRHSYILQGLRKQETLKQWVGRLKVELGKFKTGALETKVSLGQFNMGASASASGQKRLFRGARYTIGPGKGAGIGNQRVGRRLGNSSRVHDAKGDALSNPVRIVPPKSEARSITLQSQETDRGEPLMHSLSQSYGLDLNEALDEFVQTKRVTGMLYGMQGDLADLQTFIRDPNHGRVRSGGIPQKLLKEIVLAGHDHPVSWTPVLDEAFHFLFERGFKVTVYTSAVDYVEGIGTVGDLKRVVNMARPTPLEDIKTDMAKRKQKGSYEVVNLADIQEKVAGVYIYGLARAALLGQKLDTAKGHQAQEETAVGELSPEEQYQKAVELLRVLGVLDLQEIKSRLGSSDEDNGATTLILTSIQMTGEGLKHLAGMTKLQKLALGWTKVDDKGLEYLIGLPQLKELSLLHTQVTDDGIFKLMAAHPNGENLVIWNREGKKIKWSDVPESYKKKGGGLSFEEQKEKARQILRALGVHESKFFNRIQGKDEKNVIFLDLGGTGLTDAGLAQLEGLEKLEYLYINNTAVTKEGVYQLIARHPNREHILVEWGNSNHAIILANVPEEYIIEAGASRQREMVYQMFRELGVSLLDFESLIGLDDQKRVISLNFGQLKVTDAMLEQLEGLKQLETLDLKLTLVTNAGLRHLAGLTKLRRLSLSFTKVDDEGLKYLTGLTQLEMLGLSSTQITAEGLKFLMGMTQLKELHLSDTQVTRDMLYKFIGEHPNGENLWVAYGGHMSHVQWSDVPAEYKTKGGELTPQMQRLMVYQMLDGLGVSDVDRDKYIGFDQENRVVSLSLQNLQVTDAMLEQLKGLKQLERLYLLDTPITSAGLKHLAGLTKLEKLVLSFTEVDDEGLEYLKGFPRLKRLVIKNTKVTDDGIFKFMASHPNGENLVVWNRDEKQIGWSDVPEEYKTKGGGLTPQMQRELARQMLRDARVNEEGIDKRIKFDSVKGVTSIEFSNTLVEDKDLEKLKDLKQLEELVFVGADKITDAGLEYLKGLTGLTFLELSSTKVTDAGLEKLKGLIQLNTLYLYNDKISNEGLKHLKGLTQLQRLDLGVTQITGAGLEFLTGFTQLRHLTLYRNQIAIEKIYEFIAKHPNRENLKVWENGKEIGLSDVPEEYKTKGGELTPQMQGERIRQLLQKLNVPMDSNQWRIDSQPDPEAIDYLNLGDTNVVDTDLEQVKGLTLIQELELYKTAISDIGIGKLKGLTQLRRLSLGSTKITDAGVESLKGLTELQTLYLNHTQITDAGLEPLKGLTQLSELVLIGTQVTDEGIIEFIASHPNKENLTVINAAGKKITSSDVPAGYKAKGGELTPLEKTMPAQDKTKFTDEEGLLKQLIGSLSGDQPLVLSRVRDRLAQDGLEGAFDALLKKMGIAPEIQSAAMLTPKGGIDFTANRVPLEIKGNDIRGIKFYLDPAMLARLQKSPGFTPVIISIQPAVDLKAFLGITDK